MGFQGCKGKHDVAPAEYRLPREGETVPRGYLWYDVVDGSWRAGSGAIGSRILGGKAFHAAIAFPLSTKAPRKSPKRQETSIQAHDSQKAKAPLDRVILLDRIRKCPTGISCDRLEGLLGMKHQTASARLRDLAIAGKIVDSGRRETTSTGRKAICWKVVVS